MKVKRQTVLAVMLMMAVLTLVSTRLRADVGICGGASITLPFMDVPNTNTFFCSIAEAYFSGLSNGTTATTYSPGDPVPREQMAAFVSRTMDQSLKRGSRRAALKQFWTPTSADDLGLTTVGNTPRFVASDGADLWVANAGGTVSRVRASDGKLLDTWTGAVGAYAVLSAKGLIFVTGQTVPGRLYQIDPTQPSGAVTTVSSTLGNSSTGMSFDGERIWTANSFGTVSIVTLNPLSVSTVSAGFAQPWGLLYDGSNMWLTDIGTTPGKLFKLDSNGAIIQTVTMDTRPYWAVFDGTNIWVPNADSNTLTVVRASTGTVLATLTGNGLDRPRTAAFDGERIVVANTGDRVSLWHAADLTPLGFVTTPVSANNFGVFGACSDGLNFWITLAGTNQLARF